VPDHSPVLATADRSYATTTASGRPHHARSFVAGSDRSASRSTRGVDSLVPDWERKGLHTPAARVLYVAMLAALFIGLVIAMPVDSWIPLVAGFVAAGLLYLGIRAVNQKANPS
jgi:Flp pilus assembly protein TadB